MIWDCFSAHDHKEWLFELPELSCQLQQVWPFSSVFSHYKAFLPTEIKLTDVFFFLFNSRYDCAWKSEVSEIFKPAPTTMPQSLKSQRFFPLLMIDVNINQGSCNVSTCMQLLPHDCLIGKLHDFADTQIYRGWWVEVWAYCLLHTLHQYK